MSDLNDLIHTNAMIAFNQGAQREQERILKVLKPHAEHDDWCADGCYSEDCSAPLVQWLIKKILETDLQENVNNDAQKGV
jgi:hypothetical protein